jgi:sRNA-binding regulator protein Hfq
MAPTTPSAPVPAAAPAAPDAPASATVDKAARRPWRDDRIQDAWYERNRDRPVRVRFLDGSGLSGVLVGADTYTLALRVPERQEVVLVAKHAVAVLLRREAPDESPAGAAAGAPGGAARNGRGAGHSRA